LRCAGISSELALVVQTRLARLQNLFRVITLPAASLLEHQKTAEDAAGRSPAEGSQSIAGEADRGSL